MFAASSNISDEDENMGEKLKFEVEVYLFYHNAQESIGRKQRKDHYSVI